MEKLNFSQMRSQSTRSAARYWSTTITPLGLAALLGMTGGAWVLQAAIAPQVAQAYTARVSVAIDSFPEESYETLVRRAETTARAAAQRSFDSDILITEVVVTIVGENAGAVAPILALEVSRNQWRSRPDTQRWATYFRASRALLGYERPTPPTATTPGVAPADQVPTAEPGVVPASGPPSTSSPSLPAQPTEQTTPAGATPSVEVPVGPDGQPGAPTTTIQIPGQGTNPEITLPVNPDGQVGTPTITIPGADGGTFRAPVGDNGQVGTPTQVIEVP